MLTLVITDGRGEYLERSLASAQEMIPNFSPVIVDDSGDAGYRDWIMERWPNYASIHHGERRGMAGAVRSAWEFALSTTAKYVFHMEDDFTFTQPVEIQKMIATMREEPRLAQLVLKRQPWSDEEKHAGDLINLAPNDFTDRDGWIERTDNPLYSFNPHLVRRDAIELAVNEASTTLEREITDVLVPAGYRFGCWGSREDGPRCHHIGETRSAGYRW